MFKIKANEEITIVGVSELRSKTYDILEQLRHGKILLTRRNKPEAVLIGYQQFQELEQQLEKLEDEHFGRQALLRLKRNKKKKGKPLSHREMTRKYGT